jgi:eukaryotic-like serine/threonine-protein kinase
MATLPPGTRVGPYEVVGPLGAGGMGEVFRARDLTLHRDVALKVLLPAYASDHARRARFAREARLLAALNHPHVAQIYSVEDSAAGPAIAMELVEGRTLRDVLQDGGLPRHRATDLARQIASALDAAHEKGFVHRDLKPGNIMVTPDGAAKILDFGLAKIWADDDSVRAHAATMTATALGEIAGTPAYMSPEQATGQPVDRRTDVWAFGCVLYEMLAGRQAFPGATVEDTMAAVIGRDPDWNALPAGTAPALRTLVMRCLEKDRRRRLRDIGDALHDLSPAASDGERASSPAGPAAMPARERSAETKRWTTLGLAVSALVAGALAMWGLMPASTSPAASPVLTGPVRFALSPPPGRIFGGTLPSIEATTLEFSPDGARLAFLATGAGERPQIWIRALADEMPTPVAGTAGAISMFWSPDGRTLGFFADGQLRRVALDGGAPVKICDVASSVGMSGTWGAHGDILFSSVQADAIYRVSAAGGTPVPVISARPETGLRAVWPRFLPNSRQFLFTSFDAGFKGHVMLAEADGGATPILDALSHARWVEPDWVLFVREGTLLAQRVDLRARRTVGDPVSVAGRVAYSAATGWADFTASANGSIAVQTHRDESRLTWFDRTGQPLAHVGAPAAYFTVSLSPDDATLLFTRSRPELGTYDLWSTNLARGTEAPVTTSPGMETGEVWLPNGREVLYSAAEGTAPNLHHRNLVTGVERRLLSSPRFHFPTAVSPDGTQVFYQQRTELGTWDVLSAPLDDPTRVTPVLATGFSEHSFRMSPDGARAAFVSDESGRPQAYVVPWPITGEKIMVSTGGGARPRWGRSGRELYFLSAGQLMMVPIDAGGNPGAARALFDARGWLDFDVARDGRVIANVISVVARELPLSVIVNWSAAER